MTFLHKHLKIYNSFRTPIECGSMCSLNRDCIGFTVIKANCYKLRLNEFLEVAETSANAWNVWLSQRYQTILKNCFQERTSFSWSNSSIKMDPYFVEIPTKYMAPYECLKTCREINGCKLFEYAYSSQRCYRTTSSTFGITFLPNSSYQNYITGIVSDCNEIEF